ncbi:MAG: C39 family peptidase [Patescibacteria group bacterium]
MRHLVSFLWVGIGAASFFAMPTVAQGLPAVLLSVPFTSQAPTGDWSDPHFQNGCEEASIIMAMHWVRGTTFTSAEVVNEIMALAEYEERRFYTFDDISVRDMQALLAEYYSHTNATAVRGIILTDIKRELNSGNLVIVPVNGRLLGNPFFTSPGPLHHMVVIRGYDDATQQFITNDPGTRRGELYRYSYQKLFDAIREYPRGDHRYIPMTMKSMLVVRR